MRFVFILVSVFVIYIVWKYWTLLIGAGYDPTPMKNVHKMLELARVNEKDVVYDLGSGDGRILITAVKKYGCRAVGIEADPFRFVFSWFNILVSGQVKKVRVKFGNFFNTNINEASVVTLFLFGPTNNRLKSKLQNELKKGSRIVSYIWTFDNWQEQTALFDSRLYLYVVDNESVDNQKKQDDLLTKPKGTL